MFFILRATLRSECPNQHSKSRSGIFPASLIQQLVCLADCGSLPGLKPKYFQVTTGDPQRQTSSLASTTSILTRWHGLIRVVSVYTFIGGFDEIRSCCIECIPKPSRTPQLIKPSAGEALDGFRVSISDLDGSTAASVDRNDTEATKLGEVTRRWSSQRLTTNNGQRGTEVGSGAC
ncbi:hypothetical protein RRG08_004299 [Elysia crispata]|uniref:Uncharacterized protein n=1 Tax=Elysia crispata TaxID=231223 RepID=A0AAE1CWS3_9GAST|nr:hypothetical protein RRG08_004299 [Elysia crispata]